MQTDTQTSTQPTKPRTKERRGFASMTKERQREIAAMGGRAAHAKGTAHEWDADEATAAGRKGGTISRGGRGRLTPGAGDQSDARGRVTHGAAFGF